MPAFRAFLLALGSSAALALPAHAQIPDTFTNLKVFPKNISRQELVSAMRNFSLALGVRCEHCHAPQPNDPSKLKFSADDKVEKRKARAMMEMVRDINGKYLSSLPHDHADGAADDHSHIEVRCVTCHRGQPRPRMLQDVLADEIRRGGVPAAQAKYAELKQRYYGSFSYDFSDRALIELGSRLRAQKQTADAVAMLRLNTSEHPESLQAHAQLAEALVEAGDKAAATEELRKVLQLDPQNAAAKRRLDDLSHS